MWHRFCTKIGTVCAIACTKFGRAPMMTSTTKCDRYKYQPVGQIYTKQPFLLFHILSRYPLHNRQHQQQCDSQSLYCLPPLLSLGLQLFWVLSAISTQAWTGSSTRKALRNPPAGNLLLLALETPLLEKTPTGILGIPLLNDARCETQTIDYQPPRPIYIRYPLILDRWTAIAATRLSQKGSKPTRSTPIESIPILMRLNHMRSKGGRFEMQTITLIAKKSLDTRRRLNIRLRLTIKTLALQITTATRIG
ncbi:hypothetical protein BDN72DRAFT_528459 [Pluteus cervinus]|uniref:Uncharacterized protein n=1 Tax=Pluteus cervinus TaxID=181527 RepID=A0ACD3AZ82_9AGAR|nr:hypothetical protein BDN72DRAFT_528459 [Pluteus cervinus]